MSDQPTGPEYPPPPSAYPPPPPAPPPQFAPPPPPPPSAPPPQYAPPPPYAPPAYQPPPGYQSSQPGYAYPAAGQMPAPINPASAGIGTAGFILGQFGGYAAWSIGLGLVSIVVPFVSTFYFPVLPIAGAINGIRAIQRGRVIGGAVGIGVNILGGLVSLFASGLLGGS